jgi:hypothetical protein
MKQSKAWVMATLGVLALSACGTQTIPPITTDTTIIDNGDNGGNGGGGGGGGGTGDSRIPTGPAGDLTKNADFKLSKEDAQLLRGIIDGLSQGNGPVGILGGIVGLGKALGPELNNGEQMCDDGGKYKSNSTGGDADKDGIPVSAFVTFTDCKYSFNSGAIKLKLNGTLELEDHNPNDDDNSFLFVAKLNVSGSGNLPVGSTNINLNTSADLHLGLDIIKKSSSYDIDFGVKLDVDNKTVSARLDATVLPENTSNYAAGGVIKLDGKVGYTENGGTNTIVGFSSAGLTYDDACNGAITGGKLTITDGLHNLVISQRKCGYTDAKLDGEWYDI